MIWLYTSTFWVESTEMMFNNYVCTIYENIYHQYGSPLSLFSLGLEVSWPTNIINNERNRIRAVETRAGPNRRQSKMATVMYFVDTAYIIREGDHIIDKSPPVPYRYVLTPDHLMKTTFSVGLLYISLCLRKGKPFTKYVLTISLSKRI